MQNMARFIRYLVLGGFWTEEEERLGIGGHCGSNQGRQSEHNSAAMAKRQLHT